MARSTFYYHLKKITAADKNADVNNMIIATYNEHKGRYGYRRITASLRHQGVVVNHKKVLRIMHDNGLKSMVRIKKYRSYTGEQGKIAKNLLKRNFKTNKPNQKWVTDVTEFSVAGKRLYLSPILDLYNGEIVSYNISDRPSFYQTMDMLEKALNQLSGNTRLILHSDQGWQYQMKQFQDLLKSNGIKQSMSRKGNCLDNAVMENFFGILKSELFYTKRYNSIDCLKKDLIEYIEYYNNQRIKQKLNGLSPVQYRAQAA
jgi:putative transposase